MDIVSLGFLFLIVLGGGASAFLADWLGWRIGKKRHSLWGMRPKHFARLVVTIAGALIPLFTIGLLAGSFQGVRVWILRGREAAEQLPGVTRELKGANDRLATTRKYTEELTRQNAERKRILAEQQRQLDDQSQKLGDQGKKIGDQVLRIGTLRGDIGRLTTQRTRSAAETRKLRDANRNVRDALRNTQVAFKSGQASLKALKVQLEGIKKQTALATADLRTVKNASNDIGLRNRDLTVQNLKLEKSIADLQTATTELEAQIERLRSDQADAERDTATARAERDQLRDEVSRLDRERRNAEDLVRLYQTDSQQTRLQALTFRSGDELARIVVSSGASVADVRATIEAVLRQARLEAERKGSRPNPNVNPPMRAADLIVGELKGKPISPAEQVDRLSTALAGGRTETVLVARSSWNIFGAEAVALDLVAFPNPIVFRAGEVVAEGRLDSRRGDEAVYAQINEFLGTRVQQRAREKNMVPVRTGGEESFGQIEPAQILSVIRIAQKEERVYRFQAIAVGDIRAGDRLKIELRLK